MGEAALREAILEATLMPPDFRLAQVFELVETVNDFDAKVLAGEQKVAAWRQSTDEHLENFRNLVANAAAGIPPEQTYRVLEEMTAPLFAQLRTITQEMEVASLVREPQVQAVLKKVRSDRAASIAINQRVLRAYRVRLSYLDSYIHCYYEMLALLASYDPDAKPSGDAIETPEQLEAFFHRLAG